MCSTNATSAYEEFYSISRNSVYFKVLDLCDADVLHTKVYFLTDENTRACVIMPHCLAGTEC